MKLKLDENLSRHLKEALVALGHDVQTVADEGLLSRPEVDIAAAAAGEGRVLFTLDVDFGNVLRFPPGTHPGIVLFRPASLGPKAVNEFIERFERLQDIEALSTCLAIVEPGRVRVRRPPT